MAPHPRLVFVAAVALALAGACADDPSPQDSGLAADAAEGDGEAPQIDAAGACGPETCDPNDQICVVRGPIGPGYSYTCESIPSGCESDRTCSCTAATYCTGAFDTCSEDTANNTITCECPQCQ